MLTWRSPVSSHSHIQPCKQLQLQAHATLPGVGMDSGQSAKGSRLSASATEFSLPGLYWILYSYASIERRKMLKQVCLHKLIKGITISCSSNGHNIKQAINNYASYCWYTFSTNKHDLVTQRLTTQTVSMLSDYVLAVSASFIYKYKHFCWEDRHILCVT